MAANGSDSTCVRGDSSKPCASLDKARDIAQCGDGVSIAGGTYNADQNLSAPTNACNSNPVVFRVASGTTANFNEISMNSPGTTLIGINIPNTPGNSDLNSQGYNIDFEKDCNGCALYNSTIRTFSIWGSDGVTIEGNTIDANGTDSSIEIQDVGNSDGGTNIVIRNNIIKRFFTDFIVGSHSEGLNIGGWTDGITVEGNTFTDNGTTSHIFFTYWGTSAYLGADSHTTYPRNACVRGNTFGPTHGAYFDINYREEIPYPQANIKIDPGQNASTTNPEFNANC
jgi:hypothetical protein